MANELYRNRMLNDIDYAVREAKSAALLAHNGLVGRVRELMVSRLLAPMLPAGFEVGTGKITNAAGALSHETDLVIYNRSILPPVFYSDRDGVFPLESSYYAIEVKSKLTAADIKTSVEKGASITALSQRSPDSNTLHSSPTVLVSLPLIRTLRRSRRLNDMLSTILAATPIRCLKPSVWLGVAIGITTLKGLAGFFMRRRQIVTRSLTLSRE